MNCSEWEEGLIAAKDVKDEPEPAPLFIGVYPANVCAIYAPGGVGKSSIAYAFAVHAAEGLPLWGYNVGDRPQKVLYLDPENKSRRSSRLNSIGYGKPDNLTFHNCNGVDLMDAETQQGFVEMVSKDGQKPDIIIFDHSARLFNIIDENSNAEASRQMKFLGDLSDKTGAAVLLLGHTGKQNELNSNSTIRGAQARTDQARCTTSLSRKRVNGVLEFTLKIEKTNFREPEGTTLKLRSVEQERFEKIADGLEEESISRQADAEAAACRYVLNLLNLGGAYNATQMQASKPDSVTFRGLNAALKHLSGIGAIKKWRDGTSVNYGVSLPELE